MRANPDVAYDASPNTGFAVYDSVPYSGTSYGWLTVGGTSAGAPQWAAILAIADQGRAAASQPALDSSSPQEVMTTLYKNPGDFHDITSGTSTGSPALYGRDRLRLCHRHRLADGQPGDRLARRHHHDRAR